MSLAHAALSRSVRACLRERVSCPHDPSKRRGLVSEANSVCCAGVCVMQVQIVGRVSKEQREAAANSRQAKTHADALAADPLK